MTRHSDGFALKTIRAHATIIIEGKNTYNDQALHHSDVCASKIICAYSFNDLFWKNGVRKVELLEAHSQTVYTSRIYMPYCVDSLH